MPRKKSVDPPPRRKRNTGSIRTMPDGTVRARLPARIDPRRTAKEFPPGHQAEAEAWLDGRLNPQPVAVPSAPATLGAWAGTWWQAYVELIRPPNTAAWYLYALRQLMPLYAVALADLRPSMLQAIIAGLATHVSPATVANMAGVWRRCLDAAVEDELIGRNPARRLALPPLPERPAARHVTAREVGLLWVAIEGSRFEAAYALMLGCGLRIGEILGLAWAHVDLTEHRAWIGPQFTNGHWRDTPKGRNPHWIPLPPRVVAALIRHRDRQPPGTVLVMQSPYKPTRRSKHPDAGRPRPWSRERVATELRAIVAGLGLAPMTPHAGRHGLVTALLDGGVPAAVVAERVGHRDASITLRASAGRSVQGRSRADEAVDRYLGGAAPEAGPGTESGDKGDFGGD